MKVKETKNFIVDSILLYLFSTFLKKNKDDKKIIQAAPSIHDSLSKSCSKRFDIVLSTLKV